MWALHEAGHETIVAGNHFMEIADKTGTLAGELINYVTGNALNRAQNESKGVNMTGPTSPLT